MIFFFLVKILTLRNTCLKEKSSAGTDECAHRLFAYSGCLISDGCISFSPEFLSCFQDLQPETAGIKCACPVRGVDAEGSGVAGGQGAARSAGQQTLRSPSEPVTARTIVLLAGGYKSIPLLALFKVCLHCWDIWIDSR